MTSMPPDVPPIHMDLKRFNTETFLADRSELLEFLHGGFLLDYYYPLPYRTTWLCRRLQKRRPVTA